MAAKSHRSLAPAAAEGDEGRDPFVMELVERGMAPYARLLTAEQAEELRNILELVLETHPAVAPAVARIRRRRTPSQSGAEPRRNGSGT